MGSPASVSRVQLFVYPALWFKWIQPHSRASGHLAQSQTQGLMCAFKMRVKASRRSPHAHPITGLFKETQHCALTGMG